MSEHVKLTVPPEVMPEGMAPSDLAGLRLDLRPWSGKGEHRPFLVISMAKWTNSLDELELWVRRHD